MVKKIVVIFLVIFVSFCVAYHKFDVAAWKTPVGYDQDSLFFLATVRAYQQSDIYPLFVKNVSYLNAPFLANWSDFPITEEFQYYFTGVLAKFLGLFAASNLALLILHLLAGLAFFLVARNSNINSHLAIAGSIIYGTTPFLFIRSLQHFPVSAYWHLPFCIWLIRCLVSKDLKHTKMMFIVACVAGFQNPYYSLMLLQLLGFVFIFHFLRKDSKLIKMTILLGLVTSGSFFLMHLDTLIYSIQNGFVPGAVTRSLAELELYGLKTIDLIAPGFSRWSHFSHWFQRHYFTQGMMIPPELKGSGYFGLVGIAAFLTTITYSMFCLFKNRFNRIPMEMGIFLWVFLFSVVGGANYLVGVFGIQVFRATNRLSIVLLTLVLLFFFRFLSSKISKLQGLIIGIFLVGLHLWEVIPYSHSALNQQIERKLESDRDFTKKIEALSGPEAMIFQLPFVKFPEMPPIYNMTDYEHFRPYLHSHSLRFSYGGIKGRYFDTWHESVSALSPHDMIATLEKVGFSGIYINKLGYRDGVESFISAIKKEGYQVAFASQNGDIFFVPLKPANPPQQPDLIPIFDRGWSPSEPQHRWAIAQKAQILFENQSDKPRDVQISFRLGTWRTQKVSVYLKDNLFKTLTLTPGELADVKILLARLETGRNKIRLESDTPPDRPSPLEGRMLSFYIKNLTFIEQVAETD